MYVLFIDESGGARAPLGEALLRTLGPAHEAISASWSPSHVRVEIREVLAEIGVHSDGIRARGLSGVSVEDVDVVVRFVEDEGRLRLSPHARQLRWVIPDPLASPPDERLEACRAARDEIERRVLALVRELG